MSELAQLEQEVVNCRTCPRLVSWREQVASERRAAYRDETYWGRPVPAFGDPKAQIALIGLAPAAHGANRTGRMFTGDRSGDFLYAGLFRTGLANQPESSSRDDGLRLTNAWISAVVRCAPPANKPTPDERDNCLPYLARELQLLPNLRVIVCLGAFGWDGALRALAATGTPTPKPKPKFGHGAELELGGISLLGCYHPSQQNTFTGRITPPMLDEVLNQASFLAAQ